MREDLARNRIHNGGANNLAILHCMGANLLRNDKTKKYSLKVRRKQAGGGNRLSGFITHKLTSQLIHANQVISMETLRVKNMVKNPQLAKALSDSNWGEQAR